MKTLTRLFILLFVMAGVSSCYTGIPLKQGKSENNRTYEAVSYTHLRNHPTTGLPKVLLSVPGQIRYVQALRKGVTYK